MSTIEDKVCENLTDHNAGKSDVGKEAVENLIQKIQERAKMGLDKYGTTMDRTDLSSEEWDTHLSEELMDVAVYMTKKMKDNPNKYWYDIIPGGLYWMILRRLIVIEMTKIAED